MNTHVPIGTRGSGPRDSPGTSTRLVLPVELRAGLGSDAGVTERDTTNVEGSLTTMSLRWPRVRDEPAEITCGMWIVRLPAMQSRWMWVAAVAACGGGHATFDAGADSGPSGRVAIRGSCAFSLGPSGELVFPDTAVGVQTSYRAIDVVNGGAQINGRELIHWAVEGGDAADFSVSNALTEEDQESCSFHEWDTVIFPPGQSCRLDVMFHPTTAGAKHATLHVTYRDVLDQTFAVSGTAIAAPSQLYATTPDVYVRPQTITQSQGFMLVNAGTTSVDLGNPVITGPFGLAGLFPQSGWNCPSPLTPGAACNVGAFAFNFALSASGCPSGSFTTSTGAITVPLTARYVPSTLTIDPPTFGSVRVDPGGQICTAPGGAACQARFDTPTAVTLTATPETNGHFIGWYPMGQAVCGTSPTCTLAAGFANAHVAPRFASAQAKAIAVTVAGTGTVDAGYPGSCSASCTLYSEPGGGLVLTESTTGSFMGWSGDCTGTQTTCNLGTVINDRAVTATFSP